MTQGLADIKSFMGERISLKRWRFLLVLTVLFFFATVAMDVIFDISAKKLVARITGALFMSALWAIFCMRAKRPLGSAGGM